MYHTIIARVFNGVRARLNVLLLSDTLWAHFYNYPLLYRITCHVRKR